MNEDFHHLTGFDDELIVIELGTQGLTAEPCILHWGIFETDEPDEAIKLALETWDNEHQDEQYTVVKCPPGPAYLALGSEMFTDRNFVVLHSDDVAEFALGLSGTSMRRVGAERAAT